MSESVTIVWAREYMNSLGKRIRDYQSVHRDAFEGEAASDGAPLRISPSVRHDAQALHVRRRDNENKSWIVVLIVGDELF